MSAFVVLDSVFLYLAKRLAGEKMSPKWPILCWVGRKPLSLLINIPHIHRSFWRQVFPGIQLQRCWQCSKLVRNVYTNVLLTLLLCEMNRDSHTRTYQLFLAIVSIPLGFTIRDWWAVPCCFNRTPASRSVSLFGWLLNKKAARVEVNISHDGMQYDPIQGQGHEPLKVVNLTIF